METCVLMLGGDCWHLLTLANLGNLFGLYGIVWVSPGTCRVSPCVTSMSPRLWPQRSGADAGAPGAVGGPSAPGEVHDAPWADGAAERPSEFCVAGREEKEIEERKEKERSRNPEFYGNLLMILMCVGFVLTNYILIILLCSHLII